MRVTRDSLIRIAKETAQERAYNDRNIIAAYLTGALASDQIDPMLGGTADVDIIFVHSSEPKHRREYVRLTPDFHVDISHRAKAEFKRPRELRLDPWLGWEMYDPMLLMEREKFFEFVQAGLRAGFEFNAPAPALQRSRSLLGQARQLWRELLGIEDIVSPQDVNTYLNAMYHAINAVAELSGPPLHDRRLLLDFPARAEMAQRVDMVEHVYDLLGASSLDVEKANSWLAGWRSDFEAACESSRVDERIHPTRLNYYDKAILSMLESENPRVAIWALIQTWTLAVGVLPDNNLDAWRSACGYLGFNVMGIEDHVNGLDHFLDEVEALLDELAARYGLDVATGV